MTLIDWKEAGKTLDIRLGEIHKKYEAVRSSVKVIDISEELNTSEKVETVKTIIEFLGVRCELKEWIDMNNSLIMTGTLYERAEADIRSEIESLFYQRLCDKLDDTTLLKTARNIAENAHVQDIERFMADIQERLKSMKQKLEEEKK
jgi:hypothetical protein